MYLDRVIGAYKVWESSAKLAQQAREDNVSYLDLRRGEVRPDLTARLRTLYEEGRLHDRFLASEVAMIFYMFRHPLLLSGIAAYKHEGKPLSYLLRDMLFPKRERI